MRLFKAKPHQGTQRATGRLRGLRTIALPIATGITAFAAGIYVQDAAYTRGLFSSEFERTSHVSVDWMDRRNMPVARIHGPRIARFADIVLVDGRTWRSSWRSWMARKLTPSEVRFYGPGGDEMQRAMVEHPLVLMRMQIDCGRGRWRIAGSAISDRFNARPVAVAGYPIKPGRGWIEMSGRNRTAVCDNPEPMDPFEHIS